MYVLFGTKWTKIFAGPMWSYAPIMQGTNSTNLSGKYKKPVDVSVHVALLDD